PDRRHLRVRPLHPTPAPGAGPPPPRRHLGRELGRRPHPRLAARRHDLNRQAGRAVPTPPPQQDTARLVVPPHQPRHRAVAQPPRLRPPPYPGRHHHPRPPHHQPHHWPHGESGARMARTRTTPATA